MKRFCSDCGRSVRQTDRFCPSCGRAAHHQPRVNNAPNPFVPSNRLRDRLVGFVTVYWRVLLGLGVVAVLVLVVPTQKSAGVGEDQRVSENRSSPGYGMVRSLKKSGAIESFRAVKPDSGWTSQYELDDGPAALRFRGDRMEYTVPRSDLDLTSAIIDEAERRGFASEAEIAAQREVQRIIGADGGG